MDFDTWRVLVYAGFALGLGGACGAAVWKALYLSVGAVLNKIQRERRI
jgi:hypothetical protein